MPQVKTKITRAVLLDDLYKNLKMGTTSTTDILGRVRDPDLRAEMTKTIDGFEGLASRVSKLMIEAGISLEDIHKELASRHVIDHKVKQEKMT